MIRKNKDPTKEPYNYHVKMLLYEEKDNELDRYISLSEKLSELGFFVDKHYISNEHHFGVDNYYHFDGSTILFSEGPTTSSFYPAGQRYMELYLISNRDLSDTVNKLFKHIKFFKKFQEVEHSAFDF